MAGKTLIGIIAGLTMLGNVAFSQNNNNTSTNSDTKTELDYKSFNGYAGEVVKVKEKTMYVLDNDNLSNLKAYPLVYELIDVKVGNGHVNTIFVPYDSNFEVGDYFDLKCRYAKSITYDEIANYATFTKFPSYKDPVQKGVVNNIDGIAMPDFLNDK